MPLAHIVMVLWYAPPMWWTPLLLACQPVVPVETAVDARANPEASLPSPLIEVPAVELVDRIRRRALTSGDVTRAFLARIDETNEAGPGLRAVIATDPEALTTAAARDADDGRAGLLFGLPVLLKDNIDAQGMPTTAGSLALAEHRPDDAFLVRRLREAGAVVLGKANLSEWANFRSTGSSSGWSAVGGQVRNPHVLDRSPCGSSSGSAVAVAAGLAPVAIGTETDGSILCPASINGIVGVKPTVGLVSRDGIVPISHSQDTAGPMTRTVTDAALLLEVLAAHDPDDPASAARPAALDIDYRAALSATALRGARLGVLRPEPFEAGTLARFDIALADLERQGAVLVELEPLPDDVTTKAQDQELDVLLYEFSRDLAAYLTAVDGFDTLHDLVAFNDTHAGSELRWFGQELFERAADLELSEADYLEARRASQAAYADFLDARLAEHDLVAIVTPTMGPAWPIDPLLGDRPTGGTTEITAVSGYPAVTVPMGRVEGLPVGLSFLGAAWQEARLLGLAFAYEQASRHRVAPAFRPSLLD